MPLGRSADGLSAARCAAATTARPARAARATVATNLRAVNAARALASTTLAFAAFAVAAATHTLAAAAHTAAAVPTARMPRLVPQLGLAEHRPTAHVGTAMRVEHVRFVCAVHPVAAATTTEYWGGYAG